MVDTEHIVDLLAPLGPIVTKSLFGAQGLYVEDRVFGLVARGGCYFRTSPRTIERYLLAGSQPFVYYRSRGGIVVTDYHQVPASVLDDRDQACAWAYEAAGA